MRSFYPEANRETVVKKINSLRTAYRKELKKVVQSEKSGAGEEEIYVPHLWYFGLLNLLQDQEVPRSTQTNIDEVETLYNETTPELDPESPSLSLPATPSSSASGTPRSCTPQLSRQPSNKASRGVKNKCDEVLDVIGKRLAQNSSITADRFSDIGKAWTSKLRDLDPQQAVHAEKLINDVFYEAQLGNLNRNCFVKIQHEQIRNIQTHPFNVQHSLDTRSLLNNQYPFNNQQSLHSQPSYNTPPPFNNQPPFNSHSLHTQPSTATHQLYSQPSNNTHQSFNNQPSCDTMQTSLNQPSTITHQSFNNQPSCDTMQTSLNQPSTITHQSINNQPSCDTMQTSLNQTSTITHQLFNNQPAVKTQQSASDLFRNFSDFGDGEK